MTSSLFSFQRFTAIVAILISVLPAQAWNATGHRIVAAIAYDRLTPVARARVDEMIQQHPDYATLFTAGAPLDPKLRARAAFLYAATWPDTLRNDPRFYDATRAGAVPTPLLPVFPDMDRHVTWHYYNIPYSPDGAKTKPQPPPHALSELRRMLATIAAEPPVAAAYDLPWLVHLVGDVHQPLHATSRYLKSQPKGDAGGNFVFLMVKANLPDTNLHAVWDNSAGTDTSDEYVNQFAVSATAEYPMPQSLSTNPNRWLKESFSLDKSDVYTFGLVTGSKDHPITLPSGYQEHAKQIARRRIAMAGYRLATVLNERFK